MNNFLNKIPRARIYVEARTLLKAALKLPFASTGRGETSKAFEVEMASQFGTRHVHTVSSCRVAFNLVLKSLNLKPGDEVLMTPLTIPDMVNAIHVLGLKPVFVDLSLEAQNISLEDLECKRTAKSKVLLITHLSGLVPNMAAICAVAKECGLTIIEDMSQNQGASYEGQPLGTFGVASVMTTSIAKTMSTLWGGAVLTNDPRIDAAVRALSASMLRPPSKKFLLQMIVDNLKVIFATNKLVFTHFTFYAFWLLSKVKPEKAFQIHDKPRMDGKFFQNPRVLRKELPTDVLFEFSDIHSEILRDGLRRAPAVVERRIALAHVFYAALSRESLEFFPKPIDAAHRDTHWHLPIMIPGGKRMAFQLFLLNRCIDTTGYGLALCSEEPVFAPYASSTPCARYVKENTVFLPIHDSFDIEQMRHMAESVNLFVEQNWSALKNVIFIEPKKSPSYRSSVGSRPSA